MTFTLAFEEVPNPLFSSRGYVQRVVLAAATIRGTKKYYDETMSVVEKI